jgi:hypothetical protein
MSCVSSNRIDRDISAIRRAEYFGFRHDTLPGNRVGLAPLSSVSNDITPKFDIVATQLKV